MFSLGVTICIAGICRIWYTSIFLNSYDALCKPVSFPPLHSHSLSLKLLHTGHGATLYAIVSIETSIGIICGCLPACKPLMSRVLPRIFATTHSSTHKSHKKATKVDGQSFPFQSLSGGIVKSEAYSVEYEDVRSGYQNSGVTAGTKVGRDVDAGSEGSEEWIMMQEDLKHGDPLRVKSGV